MSEEHDRNYRPKSPDLSGFIPPRLNRVPSYHPDPALPPGHPVSARGSYDASPFFSPQTTTPSTSYFGSRAPSLYNPPQQSPQAFRTPLPPTYSQPLPQQSYYDNSYPTYPGYSQPQNYQSFPPIYQGQQPGQQFSLHSSNLVQPYGDMPRTRRSKVEEDFDPDFHPDGPPSAMAIKTEQDQAGQPLMPTATTDPAHAIDVKTKFPVARIKRIMQADEDVGKVAQATPTAVSKALELFMITLVAKGAAEARANKSKRVTAQNLKAALMKDGQFDFLTEICENVPDEGSKKGRAKSEAKSEDSDEDVAPKKKGKGGRKRKASSDDDSD